MRLAFLDLWEIVRYSRWPGVPRNTRKWAHLSDFREAFILADLTLVTEFGLPWRGNLLEDPGFFKYS